MIFFNSQKYLIFLLLFFCFTTNLYSEDEGFKIENTTEKSTEEIITSDTQVYFSQISNSFESDSSVEISPTKPDETQLIENNITENNTVSESTEINMTNETNSIISKVSLVPPKKNEYNFLESMIFPLLIILSGILFYYDFFKHKPKWVIIFLLVLICINSIFSIFIVKETQNEFCFVIGIIGFLIIFSYSMLLKKRCPNCGHYSTKILDETIEEMVHDYKTIKRTKNNVSYDESVPITKLTYNQQRICNKCNHEWTTKRSDTKNGHIVHPK
ncbi:MAG TPA: hypothetical protein PKY81_14915 [bacterium]|nr:hypothetical protein [bacterium]